MKVTFEQLKAAFNRVLISRGVDSETADACAEMFARTTESGVYSHGVNRFPRFIQQLENGDIIPDAQPKRITSLGAIEQWDAQRSIGNLTAKKMMDRAIELAADHGIGLVALRNANHWMRSANYPVNRAAGLIASGGIIAPIIPPSIPFIIFGVSSGLSISKLFMAGIAPGMMMGATLMLTWWWQASRLNLPRQQKATMQEIWHSFVSGIWALFLPVIIIGGFRSGLFTPTEAGAVAAFYALFVATVIYREMTFATLWHVLIGAAKTTSVVMFLVASAQVSAWLITIAELPMMVSDLLQPLVDSPRLLFIVIMVAILIVGMVMDLTPTVLILTPVLMPLVKEAGIDPIYFGVMFIINCSIGLITPPIGNVLNVISGVAKLKFDDAVRGVFPYVLVLYSLLVVFVFIPDLIILPLKWIN